MNLSVIKLKSHPIQFFALCPVTKQRVAVSDSRDIELVGQQATWWRCTVCGGWHVSLEKDTVKKKEAAKILAIV